MNIRAIFKSFFPVGWRASLATVSANVRLYGWSATSRKIVRRLRVSNNFYRDFLQGLERRDLGAVEKGKTLFGAPRIYIVGSLDLPQCKKYRVLQKVEYFESLGWSCGYSHYLDESRVISNLQFSTALILYRVPAISLLDDYLNEAERLGVRTFYDIDDPIFSEEVYRDNQNLKHLEAGERAHLLSDAVRYREAMKKVDALILSTTYLQTLAASEFEIPAFLWKNLADSATLSMVESVRSTNRQGDHRSVVIAYASGSRAHDEDFNVVAEALSVVLGHKANVTLRVLGHVVIPPVLKPYRDRIEAHPFSGYLQYLQELGEVDMNIVPLTSGRFNECKSAIRYLEAALCGVPTIASRVGQFSEIITDDEDGCLADSTEDWILKLERLIDSKELRLAMGEKSHRKVKEQYTLTAEGAVGPETIEQFRIACG